MMQAPRGSTADAGSGRHPLSIVVAEDDVEMRRLLAHVLRRDGHEVVEVGDGAALVALLAMRASVTPLSVDLVITDVRMPKTDGLDVLRAIRDAGWQVPVVVITAFPDPDVRVRASRLGAVHVLDKPFDLAVLLTLAHTVGANG